MKRARREGGVAFPSCPPFLLPALPPALTSRRSKTEAASEAEQERMKRRAGGLSLEGRGREEGRGGGVEQV